MHASTAALVLAVGAIKSHQVAGIAQLVEQLICNQKVAGSIPAAGTNHAIGYQ
jgi:hypothetical protein